MRKLKIIEHITLDGVIQHSADDGDFAYSDWTAPYRSPAGRDAVFALQGESFDLLLGRRTYDIWSGFWPKAPSSPMSDALNAATKYVATHRPESLEWGPFKSLGPEIVEDIRRIKSHGGPDLILWGSSTLTSTLHAISATNTLPVSVYPSLAGRCQTAFRLSPLGRWQAPSFSCWVSDYRSYMRLEPSAAIPQRYATMFLC